ncbi:hypothetical protein SNEBB_001400 [Seison nebaliae]|nr:hypothetical protein SNEBB_001400 [Seison nebaliae]
MKNLVISCILFWIQRPLVAQQLARFDNDDDRSDSLKCFNCYVPMLGVTKSTVYCLGITHFFEKKLEVERKSLNKSKNEILEENSVLIPRQVFDYQFVQADYQQQSDGRILFPAVICRSDEVCFTERVIFSNVDTSFRRGCISRQQCNMSACIEYHNYVACMHCCQTNLNVHLKTLELRSKDMSKR